ncbi:hypothetical protein OTK49_01035 [Vibrio coralliirubri]|nr:hypothetical protein [Vibrio coralliirubri]
MNQHFNFKYRGGESEVELTFGDSLFKSNDLWTPTVGVMVGGQLMTPSRYNELKILGVKFPDIIDSVLVKNYLTDSFVFARNACSHDSSHPYLEELKSLKQQIGANGVQAISIWDLASTLEGTSITKVENLVNEFRFCFKSEEIVEALILTNALLAFCFADHSNVSVKQLLGKLTNNFSAEVSFNLPNSTDALAGAVEVVVFGFEYMINDTSEQHVCHRTKVNAGWR